MNYNELHEKTNLAPGWRIAVNRLVGAYSDNTLRGYRSDLSFFETWCQGRRQAMLPASPETVAAFIAYDAERSSPSTLRRRLASIRKLHKLLRPDDPVGDEDVRIALRRALRSKTQRPQQALGLNRELRDRLIAACPDTSVGLRNKALIAVGYDTLCRRSELVSLRVEDFSADARGKITVLIRRAKNDPFGNGRLGILSCSAANHLTMWLAAGRIETGYVFRALGSNSAADKALHPFSVNRILKGLAGVAGVSRRDIRKLSGHSMRVGAAQDMMASGLGVLPIMQAGGWKSINVVARYIEHADLGSLLNQFHSSGGT